MFKELLSSIAKALNRAKIPYMVIGGQAVLVYGEPRLTKDIDITVGIDSSHYNKLLDVCDRTGLKPLPGKLKEFVQKTNVLPALEPRTKIRVDFIFSFTPYEMGAISRAIPIKIGKTKISFASVEDVILHKLFAGRERDFEDIKGIVACQKKKPDLTYLTKWVKKFSALPEKSYIKKEFKRLMVRGKIF